MLMVCLNFYLKNFFPIIGPIFEEKVRTYLITCFRKGIPSLFKNLLTLYDNQQKVF